jgi:hypothetical protein
VLTERSVLGESSAMPRLRRGVGECWQASFSAALVNDGAQYKAKSD